MNVGELFTLRTQNQDKKIIYLDHAATAPLKREAYDAMQPYLQEEYGNPGGVYTPAVEAKKAVNRARRQIAEEIHCDANEVFFTSGGTEADNWALTGVCLAKMIGLEGRNIQPGERLHVITTSFEHHAVLETCSFLEKIGVDVTYIEPDREGFINPDSLKKAICPNTVLVSVMMANNEIGTIQPIKELAKTAHEKGAIFHTDAVQTVGHLPIDVKELDVDLLSAGAHKFGGPKGIGFLYVKQGTVLEPFMHGGGQERGRRAGTENVASIAAMAAALSVKENTAQITKMRDYLAKRIACEIPDVLINGSMQNRMAGNINVSIKGIGSEALLLHLNRYGICASGGSACTTSVKSGSHVLRSLGRTEEEALSAIRITIGEENTIEQLDFTLETLKTVVKKLRELRYE